MSDSNPNFSGTKSDLPTSIATSSSSVPNIPMIDTGPSAAANMADKAATDSSANSNLINLNESFPSSSSDAPASSTQIEETGSSDDSLTSISGLSIRTTDSEGGGGDEGSRPGDVSQSTMSYSTYSSESCSSPSSTSTVSSYTQASPSPDQNNLKGDIKLSKSQTPENEPIYIRRDPMNLEKLESTHRNTQDPTYHSSRQIFHRLLPKRFGAKRAITNLIPILKWMPRYSLKKNLLLDLIAGLTVLSLNIPEGLAYSEVGGIKPLYGLYVSIFPGIIYAFMGTSRHLSFGTFAVISLLCKHVMDSYRENYFPMIDNKPDPNMPEQIEILVVLCLVAGVAQALFGILRLGVLALVLSDNLLSSFMVGCAALICNGQIKDILGLKYESNENDHLGIPSEFINMWISTIHHLPEVNICATTVSVVVLICLCAFKFILDPYLFRSKLKLTFPFPIDLLMVIVTTIVSAEFDLEKKYGLEVVGHIPSGLHAPVAPRIDLIPGLLVGGIEIAIIASVITLSLVRVCAKTHEYTVSLNQEFVAYGTANIVGSFFLCYPSCGSVSRTNVQETTGGKTQIVTLISSSLMIVFMFFFTHYLEALPKCTLAVIIIIALFHTFERFKEVPRIWTISKLDGFQWITTFLAALVLGIDIGIIYGLSVSIVIVLIRTALPTSTIKYAIPDSEIYLSPNVFVELDSSLSKQHLTSGNQLKESPSVIVFAFQGPLTFLSVPAFYTDFESKILEPIRSLDRMRRKSLILQQITLDQSSSNNKLQNFDLEPKLNQCKMHSTFTLADQLSTVTTTTTVTNVESSISGNNLSCSRAQLGGSINETSAESCDNKLCIVLDLSQMLHIDVTGLEFIQKLKQELQHLHVEVLLASLSVSALATMERAKFFDETLPKSRCFVSVHDAVVAAKHRLV